MIQVQRSSWLSTLFFILCVSSCLPAAWAEGTRIEVIPPKTLLAEMHAAHKRLTYEMFYILVNKRGVESVRYRHAFNKNHVLAQLLYLDGQRREIVQQDSFISYFEAGIPPFTLQGQRIVDAMPSIVFANIEQLAAYYDFIAVGRARLADHLCEVVRVVARDGTRFHFAVWIDASSKLALRVDLLDTDGNSLEQYRVLTLNVHPSVQTLLADLQSQQRPPLLPISNEKQGDFAWHPQWLPKGMQEVGRSLRQPVGLGQQVESRLYSDGLFNFAINVGALNATSNREPQATLSLRQGARIIYGEVRGNREITIVGELPFTTAKRIIDGIK